MEWNNSALAVIFFIFLIPVVVVFFCLQWIITQLPRTKAFLIETRKNTLVLYVIIQIGLLILSAGLTVAVIRYLAFIKGGGLLE